jgi:S1-C subfamily serine protease
MVNEIRAQIKKLEGQTEDELKKAVAFDDKNSEKLKKERDFHEALTDMQNAVVTIQAPKGVIGSGILFSGFKTQMVVTTIQNAPADGELIVNVRYVPKGFTNVLSATAKGKLVYADKETGLAFVSIETGASIPLTTFSRDSIRAAAATEEIHLITSYASPDGIFDVIMFEGTVSSLEEMSGDRKLMRVAVVANEGSSGAPLVGMDKKLVGVFLKSVEGAEKAALVISGPDLTKAIERMPKK